MRYLRILVLGLLPFMAQSQIDMEVGVMAGASNYFGELTEDFTNLQETHPGFGIMGRLVFHPIISLESHVLLSRISGNDRYNKTYYVRNLSFSGDLTEMALSLELNLIAPSKISRGRMIRGQKVVPYFFGGIAYTMFAANVNSNDANQNYIREPFPEANDEATFVSLPGGAGFKFYFAKSNQVRVDLHGGLRYVLSDYFDGVSLNGQPDTNDWYIFMGMNIVYHISTGNNACFKF